MSEPTTGIIAGGVVGIVVIVLIIAITIAIVVIAYLVLKSRRGEFAVKKSDRKYVHYCTLYRNICNNEALFGEVTSLNACKAGTWGRKRCPV